MSSAYSSAEMVYFALHPEEDGETSNASDFWETTLGGDDQRQADADAWVRGFCEGALEIWEQVEDQI